MLEEEASAAELERGLPDNAISSLSKLFRNIVPLIHDEVLIEDLEDLAAGHICHLLLGSLPRCAIEVSTQGVR